MFIDTRALPKETSVQADICIVGAGAAGITLAREFIATPFKICLLESGGLEFDEAVQALYRGYNTGFPYYDLDALRLRYFGGTTNHWAGASGLLDDIDFEARPWVPYSGWPFDKAHLDPFYRRAHAICQLGPYDYRPDLWESRKSPRLPFRGNRVETQMLQSSPIRFGRVYRDDIRRAQNISAYLYATVVDIETALNGRAVNQIRATNFEGRELRVKAKAFVLATGAIENARILLTSNSVQKYGLGNDNDLVGRFFMEHLSVPGAMFLPSNPRLSISLYEQKRANGTIAKGFLTLSPTTLRDNKLLNARTFLLAASPQELASKGSEGALSAGFLWNAVKAGRLPDNFGQHLANILKDIDDIAIYSYRRVFEPPQAAYTLLTHLEQAPNPESRVLLAPERDALGIQRVQLTWRFGDLEKSTLARTNEIIALELGYAGLGRVRILPVNPETGWPSGVRGAWHQMGTTRMHPDSRQGVVDEHCRVHGLANLYIAGSSVFPTSGYANPTLTIVALALRLSDYLKKRL